jgi:RHS repeat-associated protein
MKICSLKPRPKSSTFGSSINTRSFSAGSGFRFGFNGKENFDQYQDYGMRIYYPNLGKFLSNDPLASERVSLTPCNFCSNNPISRVDPTGALDDDYIAKQDGTIEFKKTDDKLDRFFVENKDGSTTQVAQLEKHKTSVGTTLVKFPKSGTTFDKYQSNRKDYIQPTLAAAIFGAANEYFNETGLKVQINQLNNVEGEHSGQSVNGTNADIRYANLNGNKDEAVWTSESNFDLQNSQLLANKFTKFGFNQPGGLSILTENAKGTGPALQNTRFVDGKGKFHHKHHMHLQRYNFSNLKTVQP